MIDRRSLIIASSILVFFLILLLFSYSDLGREPKLMSALTATMTVLWLTEAVPLAVTALLPIPLFPVLGIMPSKAVALQYANHMIFLFLGGFMIAVAMEKCQLHRRLALGIVGATGNQLPRIVFGFMAATGFLSMWISNTATVMMMLPIALAMIQEVRFGDAGDRIQKVFAVCLLLGIAYAANVGGTVTLIGTPPNIIFAGVVEKLYPKAPSMTFVQWIKLAWPLSTAFAVFIWWLLTHELKRCLRKTNDAHVLDLSQLQKRPLSKAEKRVLLVFLITAFLWLFRQPLELAMFTIPGWSDLFAYSPYLHDSTVAMLMGLILFFVPSGEKHMDPSGCAVDDHLLDWQTFQSKVPWQVIFLFGGGFALAAGFQETGLTLWLADRLTLLSSLHPLLLILILCLLVTFLTEVTSNTATASVILPVLASTAVAIELHPYFLLIPATLSASCAFMLPVATPPNAIVYGSGFVSARDMAKMGLKINLVGAIWISLFVYFFGKFLLGVDSLALPPWAQ